MILEWWTVLIMAFVGGFIGGSVAYYLERRSNHHDHIWISGPGGGNETVVCKECGVEK